MTLPVPDWIEQHRRAARAAARLRGRGPEPEPELTFGPLVVCVLLVLFAVVVASLAP